MHRSCGGKHPVDVHHSNSQRLEWNGQAQRLVIGALQRPIFFHPHGACLTAGGDPSCLEGRVSSAFRGQDKQASPRGCWRSRPRSRRTPLGQRRCTNTLASGPFRAWPCLAATSHDRPLSMHFVPLFLPHIVDTRRPTDYVCLFLFVPNPPKNNGSTTFVWCKKVRLNEGEKQCSRGSKTYRQCKRCTCIGKAV
jgi:hypothetical protein